MENGNLEIAFEFIKAVGEGKTGEELSIFYDEFAKQIEYPNLLTKKVLVSEKL